MAILFVLAFGLVIVLWNQSRPTPHLLDGTHVAKWQGNYRYRTPTFANPLATGNIFLSDQGLATLSGLMEQATPVRNPIRILWEHAKYWMNSRLFPLAIWVDSRETRHWTTYYQHDDIVFLRQANHWHNAVLRTHLQWQEVETMLHTFVVPSRFDPNLPAEEEVPDGQDSGSTR